MKEENVNLTQAVWNEQELLTLLGIDKVTLDNLRTEKGFPVVRLTIRHRVYLSNEVLAWLEQRAARS